jgi:hypothetical protein
MEKVRECGLKLSREETRQVGKVCGEKECEEKVAKGLGIVPRHLDVKPLALIGNPRRVMLR